MYKAVEPVLYKNKRYEPGTIIGNMSELKKSEIDELLELGAIELFKQQSQKAKEETKEKEVTTKPKKK